MAFDSVASHINTRIEGKRQNIMYLGDSENDNPAFRKAAVSIGILSDIKLKPKLSCKYGICFNKLPIYMAFWIKIFDSQIVLSIFKEFQILL